MHRPLGFHIHPWMDVRGPVAKPVVGNGGKEGGCAIKNMTRKFESQRDDGARACGSPNNVLRGVHVSNKVLKNIRLMKSSRGATAREPWLSRLSVPALSHQARSCGNNAQPIVLLYVHRTAQGMTSVFFHQQVKKGTFQDRRWLALGPEKLIHDLPPTS